MNSSKKIMLVAAVLLLAAALFVGAGAADEYTPTDPSTAVTNFEDLKYYLQAGTNVTLGADITATGNIVITGSSVDVTLNLNGYTISAISQGILVEDSAGTPKLTINGTVPGSGTHGIWLLAGDSGKCGILVINGGTYTTEKEGDAVLYTNGSDTAERSEIHVNGATITSTKDIACYFPGKATYEITNSTITGTTGIYIKAGTVNIVDSTINANGVFTHEAPYSDGAYSTGDAIVADKHSNYAGGITLTISGTSVVHSVNGYALHECITKEASPATGTAVTQITLAGGDFQGGKDGIKTTDDLKSDGKKSKFSVPQTSTATIHQYDKSETTAYDVPAARITDFTPGPKTGETKVTMTASTDYNLIIPAEVKLSSGTTVKASVELKFIVVANSNDGGIDVRVTGATKTTPALDTKAFEMTNGGAGRAYFNIASEQSMAAAKQFSSGGKVLDNKTADATQDVYFKLTSDAPTESGSYECNLTFTAGPHTA